MAKRFLAWTGLPGTGPAPGSDWTPGSATRWIILAILYAFLALALVVNYAYGTAFFSLALLGMYVGLRRGFLTDLTRLERITLGIFAAYAVVAVASYLLGVQTNVGFRFLGRDLRFLLFIPVYVAIRWSKPQWRHVGWALLGATLADLIIAVLQRQPWPAPVPHGVTGTHITFGDLSILTGFLGAALLMPLGKNHPRSTSGPRNLLWIGAALSLIAGLTAGVLAVARGGWLAIPVMLIIFLWTPPLGQKIRLNRRILLSAVGIFFLLALAWYVPRIHQRIGIAWKHLQAYVTVANARSVNATCIDQKQFLHRLLNYSKVEGSGEVNVVRLDRGDRTALRALGCRGQYGIHLSSGETATKPLQLLLYRGNGLPRMHRQSAIILARGVGSFSSGWKSPWTRINSPLKWHRFDSTHAYRRIVSVNIRVSGKSHLWLVPVQFPHGDFAYALARSSIGQRLEMWRAAWALFLQHPWIGVGTGAFYPMGEKALGSSSLALIMGKYEHAHSDYLTSLATRGIFGLLSVLALFLVPWMVLDKRKKGASSTSLRLSAILLSGGFSVFALTESMFIHSLVISWFVVTVATLLAVFYSGNEYVETRSVPSV